MTQLALIGAPVEAFGHPGECLEPASGSVTGGGTVKVNGTPIGSTGTAELDVPSHAHDYDADEDECLEFFGHGFQPDTLAESVSLNGSPLYLTGSSIGTDPGSGGAVDITSSGGNSSVRF